MTYGHCKIYAFVWFYSKPHNTSVATIFWTILRFIYKKLEGLKVLQCPTVYVGVYRSPRVRPPPPQCVAVSGSKPDQCSPQTI